MRILLPILFVLPVAMMAQGSVVSDTLTLNSKILKMKRKYSIYLPSGYKTSSTTYPVLYLLHGGGSDHTSWLKLGKVQETADKAIAESASIPMVIVMPDAHAVPQSYVNHDYEDFFFREFMPHVETRYRIKREKRFRAISGFSAGGRGTYVYAMHHPEWFAVACPLSAAPGPVTLEDARVILMKGNLDVSEEEIETYHRKNSVVALMQNSPDSTIRSVRWYIDCGDEDFVVRGSNLHRIYEGNSLIHIALCEKEIDHEFRIRDGGHNWDYWRASLLDVLKYTSGVFEDLARAKQEP